MSSRASLETKRAALAQLVEHLIRNEGVTGSSPVSGTTSSFLMIHSLALIASGPPVSRLKTASERRDRRLLLHCDKMSVHGLSSVESAACSDIALGKAALAGNDGSLPEILERYISLRIAIWVAKSKVKTGYVRNS